MFSDLGLYARKGRDLPTAVESMAHLISGGALREREESPVPRYFLTFRAQLARCDSAAGQSIFCSLSITAIVPILRPAARHGAMSQT